MDEIKNKCGHCGLEDTCAINVEQGVIAITCLECGFTTNSYMVEGTETWEKLSEGFPQLIKDLGHMDEDKLMWYPSVINLKGIGILFPEGKSIENWYWSVAPAVRITEEEKSKFPKGQEYKTDYSQVQHFPKESYKLALVKLSSYVKN